MNEARRVGLLLVAILLATLLIAGAISNVTLASNGGQLVPIGASYQAATLDRMAEQALAFDSDGLVKIRVLFPTYASDPISITLAERAINLSDAMVRVGNVRDSCEWVVVTPTVCDVDLIDIQVRSDADNPALANQLDASIDGVFILGGDQTVGMGVLANTLTEDNLAALHAGGMPLGGTSAGAAMQSRYMIGGYASWAYAWHGLEQGAVDLWYSDIASNTRGLRFGLDGAVIDQHVLERGRLGRLLQSTYEKPGQRVGLGLDWGTGAVVTRGRLVTETAGWYAALVVDQETYSATATAVYTGPWDMLSIQNVAMHLLPAGPYGYDLITLQPEVAGVQTPAPDIGGRTYSFLSAPPAAGHLLLGGDLTFDTGGPVISRFVTLAQPATKPTLILAAGYLTPSNAVSATVDWANELATMGLTNTQTAIFTDGTSISQTLVPLLENAGALFVTGDDRKAMADQVALLNAAGIGDWLRQFWYNGGLLLLDNAAAAAAGSWMSAFTIPADFDDLEIEASDTFITGYLDIAPGLALVPGATFEPRVMYDYLYGRMVSLIVHDPEKVALGLSRATALEIGPAGAHLLGENALIVIDGRYATLLEAGSNDAFAASWLLLDTYAPGAQLWQQFWTFLPAIMAN